MSAKTKKNWTRMNEQELAAETAKFDRELPPPAPMTKAIAAIRDRLASKLRQRAKADAVAARGRGRPLVGLGAKRINVTVERSLLAEADAYARSRGMTRADIIAKGLRTLMHAA